MFGADVHDGGRKPLSSKLSHTIFMTSADLQQRGLPLACTAFGSNTSSSYLHSLACEDHHGRIIAVTTELKTMLHLGQGWQ